MGKSRRTSASAGTVQYPQFRRPVRGAGGPRYLRPDYRFYGDGPARPVARSWRDVVFVAFEPLYRAKLDLVLAYQWVRGQLHLIRLDHHPLIWDIRYVLWLVLFELHWRVIWLRFHGPVIEQPKPRRMPFGWTPGIAYMPTTQESLATLAETTTTADPGTSGTSLAVTSRSSFPQAGQFPVVVQATETDKTSREIMLVTGGQGSGAGSFTVARGQEGTSGVAHAIGSYVAMVLTAAAMKQRLLNEVGFINANTQYGAVGDGSTADATAIQNALNAAPSGGAQIRLDYGTYMIGTALTYPQDGIILRGAGYSNTVLKRSGSNIIVDMSGAHPTTTTTVKRQFCSLQNLTLHGNDATGGTTLPLMRAYYVAESTTKDLKMMNANSVGLASVEGWDIWNYQMRVIDVHGDGNGRPSIFLMASEPSALTKLTASYTAGGATMTVFDTTGFPTSGTLQVQDGTTAVTYTGKTGTTFTGCSGGGGTYQIGERIYAADVSTGMGHSADNCNNWWFFGLYIETFKDGGFWSRGAARGAGQNNKIRLFGGKIETRMVRNFGMPVMLDRNDDFDWSGANTTLGEWDTTIASQTTPTPHIWVNRTNGFMLANYKGEVIDIAANISTRSFICDQGGNSHFVLVATKFAGGSQGTGQPTVAAIEWSGTCSRVHLVGEDYTWNPATKALHSNRPADMNTPEIGVYSGAITDATFPSAPLPGAIAIDQTNNKFYAKYTDGTWHKAQLRDMIDVRVTSDVTLSGTGVQSVTGLSFAIGVSESWTFDCILFIHNAAANVGGVKVAVSVPTGATIKAMAVGTAASATTMTVSSITASATLTGVAFMTFASTTAGAAFVRITGTVVNSTTAGTFQIQAAEGTNADVNTVEANSNLEARQI